MTHQRIQRFQVRAQFNSDADIIRVRAQYESLLIQEMRDKGFVRVQWLSMFDTPNPKYATHLVYMTNASRTDEIEEKVMYSILQKRPKRADLYWFVHVNILNEPYKTEYKVTEIIKDDLFRIDFNLGFREPTKINLMFKEVLKDMVKNGEVDVTSRYESLNKNNILGDFKFVLLEKFLSNDSDLLWHEKIVMNAYFLIKKFSLSEEKAFGLDSSSVKIEKFPMVLHPPEKIHLNRVE